MHPMPRWWIIAALAFVIIACLGAALFFFTDLRNTTFIPVPETEDDAEIIDLGVDEPSLVDDLLGLVGLREVTEEEDFSPSPGDVVVRSPSENTPIATIRVNRGNLQVTGSPFPEFIFQGDSGTLVIVDPQTQTPFSEVYLERNTVQTRPFSRGVEELSPIEIINFQTSFPDGFGASSLLSPGTADGFETPGTVALPSPGSPSPLETAREGERTSVSPITVAPISVEKLKINLNNQNNFLSDPIQAPPSREEGGGSASPTETAESTPGSGGSPQDPSSADPFLLSDSTPDGIGSGQYVGGGSFSGGGLSGRLKNALLGAVIGGLACVGTELVGRFLGAALSFLQVPVGDGGNLAKECGADVAVSSAATNLMATIANQYINWAASGFQGRPLFISNPRAFWENQLDEAVGRVIDNSSIGVLCDADLSLDISVLLHLEYGNIEELPPPRCTFSDLTANLKNNLGNYEALADNIEEQFNSGGVPGVINTFVDTEVTKRPGISLASIANYSPGPQAQILGGPTLRASVDVTKETEILVDDLQTNLINPPKSLATYYAEAVQAIENERAVVGQSPTITDSLVGPGGIQGASDIDYGCLKSSSGQFRSYDECVSVRSSPDTVQRLTELPTEGALSKLASADEISELVQSMINATAVGVVKSTLGIKNPLAQSFEASGRYTPPDGFGAGGTRRDKLPFGSKVIGAFFEFNTEGYRKEQEGTEFVNRSQYPAIIERSVILEDISFFLDHIVTFPGYSLTNTPDHAREWRELFGKVDTLTLFDEALEGRLVREYTGEPADRTLGDHRGRTVSFASLSETLQNADARGRFYTNPKCIDPRYRDRNPSRCILDIGIGGVRVFYNNGGCLDTKIVTKQRRQCNSYNDAGSCDGYGYGYLEEEVCAVHEQIPYKQIMLNGGPSPFATRIEFINPQCTEPSSAVCVAETFSRSVIQDLTEVIRKVVRADLTGQLKSESASLSALQKLYESTITAALFITGTKEEQTLGRFHSTNSGLGEYRDRLVAKLSPEEASGLGNKVEKVEYRVLQEVVNGGFRVHTERSILPGATEDPILAIIGCEVIGSEEDGFTLGGIKHLPTNCTLSDLNRKVREEYLDNLPSVLAATHIVALTYLLKDLGGVAIPTTTEFEVEQVEDEDSDSFEFLYTFDGRVFPMDYPRSFQEKFGETLEPWNVYEVIPVYTESLLERTVFAVGSSINDIVPEDYRN